VLLGGEERTAGHFTSATFQKQVKQFGKCGSTAERWNGSVPFRLLNELLQRTIDMLHMHGPWSSTKSGRSQ
jgi:hypothetical protein